MQSGQRFQRLAAYTSEPALQGALLALGPALAVFAARFTSLGDALWSGTDASPGGGSLTLIWLAVTLTAGLAISLGGLLVARMPRVASVLGTVGLAAGFAALTPALEQRPGLALAIGLTVFVLTGALWRRERAAPTASGAIGLFALAARNEEAELHADSLRARAAAVPAAVAWFLIAGGGNAVPMLAMLAALASASAALACSLVWLLGLGRPTWPPWRSPRPWVAWASLPVALVAALAARHDAAGVLTVLLVEIVVLLLLEVSQRRFGPLGESRITDLIAENPARLLVLTFFAAGIGGGLVLTLPISAVGEPIGAVDAFFTAFSAVCVTGLAVRDTGSAFSGFGQGVILALIQLGGLGIMTFSTAALALLGRRPSLRHERAMAGLIADDSRADLYAALMRVLTVTFVVELLGAMALTLLFHVGGDGWAMAGWRGVFTSISAFCNAGFSLQATSLEAWATAPVVLHVVALLIVIGGLGPAVVMTVPALIRRRRVPLQVRLALATSAGLLAFGLLAFAALEWSGTLRPLSFFDRLHNAWFQSVTLRTAGFNSIDFSALRPATMMMTLGVMFVGGSPGSTAGGIKTTTVALLGLAVVAALRGKGEASAFGRRIAHRSVYKASAIATMGAISIGGVFVALALTQEMPVDVLLFEVVSALGTVGLSMGGTAMLDDVGKVVVMLAMFMGRVGPLTLFLLLMDKRGHEDRWRLPEEEVAVG